MQLSFKLGCCFDCQSVYFSQLLVSLLMIVSGGKTHCKSLVLPQYLPNFSPAPALAPALIPALCFAYSCLNSCLVFCLLLHLFLPYVLLTPAFIPALCFAYSCLYPCLMFCLRLPKVMILFSLVLVQFWFIRLYKKVHRMGTIL